MGTKNRKISRDETTLSPTDPVQAKMNGCPEKKAALPIATLFACLFSLSCAHTAGINPEPEKTPTPYAQNPPEPALEAETGAETATPAPRPEEPARPSLEVRTNARVEHYIRRFSKKDKKTFAIILERSPAYVPHLRETLVSEGIPAEIAYLPLIESGFNVRAVSRKNAVGLWQFIRPTGKRYGLRIDRWVDERMDVEKSTLAAARYMNKMFDDFGSWELALAGYNCGEGRVQRAIRRTGSKDFWKLSRKLPRETRNYLPKFYAALAIAENPRRYGFEPPAEGTEKTHETVGVPPRKSLAEIAELLGVKHEELFRLNPSLVGLSTPPGNRYELRVPAGYAAKLELLRDEVAGLVDVEFPFRQRPVWYRVRTDDSLWKIARKFRTSVDAIKRTNHISGSIIHPGQKLRIPSGDNVAYVKHRVRPGETLYGLATRYGTSVNAIKRANGLTGSMIKAGKVITVPQRVRASYAPRRAPVKTSHRIMSGDTLSELALRYRVSVSEIRRWNNLSSTRLIAGKKLLIYK